jgi:hypothetical protein
MKVHTFNVLKVSICAAIGAVATSFPAFGASISNGDFENSSFTEPTIENFFVANPFQNGFAYLGTGDTSINGWTVIGGNQDGGASYLGRGIFQNNNVSSRTVQLNGQSQQGGIATTVTGLNTGETIQVSFDLSSNIGGDAPRISVSLQNGGNAQFFSLLDQTGFDSRSPNAISNLPFTRFVTTFLYGGISPTARLSFTSQSGNNLGPIIDNVDVAVAPVPFEFSPATGIVSGAILFGSYKLIKRRKSIV